MSIDTGIGHDIIVVGSIILLEGLLSVDNALGIASMASHLPKHQQKLALRLGIIGAYAFRGVALFFAAYIAENPWLKILGALYLVYLMASELAGASHSGDSEKCARTPESENGDKTQGNEASVGAVAAGAMVAAAPGLWGTIFKIELMDLSLSLDNVVVAVGMSPGRIWPVYVGVFAGILALRFVAGWCIGLLERHPILEPTAFVLVGWVGGLLLWQEIPVVCGWVSEAAHAHMPAPVKFGGIALILGIALGSERFAPVRKLLNLIGLAASPFLRLFNLAGDAIKWPFLMAGRRIKALFGS